MTYQVAGSVAPLQVTFSPSISFLSQAVVATSGQGKLFLLNAGDEFAAQVVKNLCRAFAADRAAYSLDSDVDDIPQHLFEAREGGQSVEICKAQNGWNEVFINQYCAEDEYRPAQLMYIEHLPLALEVAHLVSQGTLRVLPSIDNSQELTQ